MSKDNDSGLSVEQELQIDRICERFEQALRLGHELSIEELLRETEDSLAPSLLRELIALEWEYRSRGESPPSRREVIDRFPEHPITVQEVLDEIQQRRPTQIPRQIGKYRIVRRIGEGGMGRVYEARQSNPNRTVALKIIRPEYASPALLGRFQREAEALGRLQHPGIGHIYEAGSVAPDMADPIAKGRPEQPFFAMEMIHGSTLTAHAKANSLDSRARVELTISICDAVQYAHQRGIIHRDLKPSNILVDDDGNPKIIDFGVARITDIDRVSLHADLHTGVGQLLGTVAYMSPEQVAADPHQIDSRCDIYALGVILYELLSGQLPLQVTDRPLPAALRSIQDDDPTRLGTVKPEYRGDIEVILSKALEKDPNRRYSSASEFAADLRRFLCHEPILARRPSVVYQVTKFSRRHRGLVFGIAMTFAVLSVSVVLLWLRSQNETRLRNIASNAEQEARKLATAETELKQDALRAKNEALEEAKRFRQINNFLQAVLSETTPSAMSESERVTVPEMLRWAVSIVPDHFIGSADVEVTVRTMLGRSLHHHGELEVSREQLLTAEAMLKASPSTSDEQRADTWEALAQSYLIGEELDLAYQYFELALVAQKRIHGNLSPEVANILVQQVGIHIFKNDLEAAIALGTLGVDTARSTSSARTLVSGLGNLGAAWAKSGKLDNAADCFKEAIEVSRSAHLDSDFELAEIYSNYGVVLRMSDRLDEAIDLYQEAIETFRASLDESHHQIAATLNNLARAYHFRGRRDDSRADFELAEKHYQESLSLRRDQLRERHPKIAESVCNLGELLHYDLGRSEEAAALFDEGLSIEREEYGDQDFRVAMHARNLGEVLIALDRIDEAISKLEEAVRILTASDTSPPSVDRINATWALATALEQARRFRSSRQMYAAIERYVEEHAPDNQENLAALRESQRRCENAEIQRAEQDG